MKKLLLFFTICILGTSCASIKYQVGNIESESLGQDLTYENDKVKVVYDFWGNGGLLYYRIYNKTDKPIYIDWVHSNFIINDKSFTYYDDNELISTSGSYDENVDARNPAMILVNGSATSSGIVEKDRKITQIPPDTYIVTKVVDLGIPYKKDIDNGSRYDESNSPKTFRTYIGYSSQENLNDLSKLTYIDNSFYVESIENIRKKDVKKAENEGKYFVNNKKLSWTKTLTRASIGLIGTIAVVAYVGSL